MATYSPAGAKPSKRSIPHRVSDRNAFILNGALLGFAIGVGMVVVTGGDVGISVLWFLQFFAAVFREHTA